MPAPPSPDPLIRFERVSKRFGAVTALDGLSLDIGEGEFFCLLGPSGCGKSTLLRLLAGFEEPTEGRVLLAGRDLAGEPPERRPLNMMFQSYALFPHLSAAENVAYGLRRAGVGRRAREARVADLLGLVQLDGVAGRLPAHLSGGQRQRVALARALAREPRVLLLDEPLGALDRRLREETGAELKAIQARLGTTFVMVTHDQDEAMVLSDRIALVERGRVAQVGTPRQVYGRPRSRFVASFLGDVNILEGTVAAAGDGRIRLATALRPEPLAIAGAAARGQRIEAALRPEALRFADPADENAWPADLVEATFEGSRVAFRLRAADGRLWRMTQPAPSGEAALPAAGGRVAVAFAPDAATALA